MTEGNLGDGLSLPANVHRVIPAGFVTWGPFFALGADNGALRTAAVNTDVGSVSARIVFAFVTATKGLPDFWTISRGVAVIAFALIVLSGGWAWLNVPVIVATFACCVLVDRHRARPLGRERRWDRPEPRGARQAGDGGRRRLRRRAVTRYGWVAPDTGVSLLIGSLCGALSVRLAAALTPRASVSAAPPANERRSETAAV